MTILNCSLSIQKEATIVDKNKLSKYFLIILPVLAVGLAATTDAVSIYNPAEDHFLYGSFFMLMDAAGDYQALPPLAGLCAIACAILSVIWVIRGGKSLLAASRWLDIAAAVCAVIPVAFCKTCYIVPSPFFSLILMGHVLLAGMLEKKNSGQEKMENRLK